MNELTTQSAQLPETLPELAQYVLIGRDRLKAVRAAIDAISKVDVAKEVYQQKLLEAQEIAEVVTDAEVRMGELIKKIPKAAGGDRRSEDFKIHTDVDFGKPKMQVIKEAGIKQHQAETFQMMANHPESVEKAKQRAREDGVVLSRKAVLNQIVSDTRKEHHRPIVEKYRQEAKERHEEFQEKKKDSIVDIKDIQQDKEDKKVVGQMMMRSIGRATGNIFAIGFFSKTQEVRDMVETMSEEDYLLVLKEVDQGAEIMQKISQTMKEVRIGKRK